MNLQFSSTAWEDYFYWQQHDRATLSRLNLLMRDILRSPFEGIGQPEPLKVTLNGYWSRRIDPEHRLVYRVANDTVLVLQCWYHY